jgi:hypothetical protein
LAWFDEQIAALEVRADLARRPARVGSSTCRWMIRFRGDERGSLLTAIWRLPGALGMVTLDALRPRLEQDR